MTREENVRKAAQTDNYYSKQYALNGALGFLRKHHSIIELSKIFRDTAVKYSDEGSEREKSNVKESIKEIDMIFPHIDLQLKAVEEAMVSLQAFVDEERILAARMTS